MPSRFSSGKHAIAECDRCGFRYKLTDLKNLVIKTKNVSIKVCPTCWDPDQPQLQLGLYPVNDPQAVREPRPDVSYYTAGPLIGGDGGSRVTQWGWHPVGLSNPLKLPNIPNDLSAKGSMGTVTASAVYIQPPASFYFAGNSINPNFVDNYGTPIYAAYVIFQPSPDPTVVSYALTIGGYTFSIQPTDTGQGSYTYWITNANNAIGVGQSLYPDPINGFVNYMAFRPTGYNFGPMSVAGVNSAGIKGNALNITGNSALLPGSSEPLYPIPTSPTSVWWTCGPIYTSGGATVSDVTVGWSPPSYAGVNGPIVNYLVEFGGFIYTTTQLTYLVPAVVIANNIAVTIIAVDKSGAQGQPYNLTITAKNLYPSGSIPSPTINRSAAPTSAWYTHGVPYTDPYNQPVVDVTVYWTAPTTAVSQVTNIQVSQSTDLATGTVVAAPATSAVLTVPYLTGIYAAPAPIYITYIVQYGSQQTECVVSDALTLVVLFP
jgi:hypothetical protein